MVDLPLPLMYGSHVSLTLGEFIRDNPHPAEYEPMFHPGYEKLSIFRLPPFQRPPVWTEEQQQYLIESLWLELPIGAIVYNSSSRMKLGADGKFPRTAEWLIDGQQRLRAILRYVAGDLEAFPGTPSAHRWNELEKTQHRRFEMRVISCIQMSSVNENELRDIYNRLCFGGTPHTPEQRA